MKIEKCFWYFLRIKTRFVFKLKKFFFNLNESFFKAMLCSYF